jgi:hypothetical protein
VANRTRCPAWQARIAGRAEEHDVVFGGDEVQRAQVGDDLAFEAAGVLEVEVLEGFAGWESGGPDPAFAAVGFSCGDLALQAGDEELLMRPGLRPGSLGQSGDGVAHRRCLQRSGQERDFCGQVPGRCLARRGGHQATSSLRPKNAS